MKQITNTVVNTEVTATLNNFLNEVTRTYSLEVTAVELYKFWARLNHEAGGNVRDHFQIDPSRTVTNEEAAEMGHAVAADLGVDIAQLKVELEAPYLPNPNAPKLEDILPAFMFA